MIDTASMRAAIVVAEWFKHEARRVYAMLAEDEAGRERRQNLEWIERNGGFVSVRGWQLMKSLPNREEAESELNELVEAGLGTWVVPKPGPRGGRPSKEFHLTAGSDTNKTPAGEAPGGVLSESGPGDAPNHQGLASSNDEVAS